MSSEKKVDKSFQWAYKVNSNNRNGSQNELTRTAALQVARPQMGQAEDVE